MNSWLMLLALPLLLAGCLGNPARQHEIARFDLGNMPAGQAANNGLAAVEVASPSWLSGIAIQYRLAFADPARRREYADSRWAAPASELVQQALERRLINGNGGRCRLRVDLDEFVQVFDTPQGSRLVMEARASLFASKDVVGRRAFLVAPAAPSADARGGVAAAIDATRALGDELGAWLAGHASLCNGGQIKAS